MESKNFIFFITALMILTSCNAQQETNTYDEQLHMQHTEEIVDTVSMARRLEHIAENHPRVKSANCVIIGKTAIIGLDLDRTMKQQRSEKVRQEVTEVIQQDSYGASAIVTVDRIVNTRLNEIAEQVSKGHPVTGFAGELIEMMKQLVPHKKKPVA